MRYVIVPPTQPPPPPTSWLYAACFIEIDYLLVPALQQNTNLDLRKNLKFLIDEYKPK
jgi:hypothetical protein